MTLRPQNVGWNDNFDYSLKTTIITSKWNAFKSAYVSLFDNLIVGNPWMMSFNGFQPGSIIVDSSLSIFPNASAT
jgi:hypothetical protein